MESTWSGFTAFAGTLSEEILKHNPKGLEEDVKMVFNRSLTNSASRIIKKRLTIH